MKNNSYAIITGVSGGIGSSLVKRLKDSNIKILGIDFITPNDTSNLDVFYKLDLQDIVINETSRNNFLKFVTNWLGNNNLELLVNNAAVQCLGEIKELDLDTWNKTLNVNLLAPFFLIQGLLDHLINSNGCVINISSIHARATKSNFIAYATSKAAISGMNRALAIELGSSISFYCIEPAAVLTEMLKAGFVNAPSKLNQLAACHPSGEISTPDQLSEFIYFLYDKRIPALQGTAIEFGGGISGKLYDPA
jgi:NAD(P)-dependent dehydrogenase (short-subunit alcohol dehydrogenase family)